MIVLLPWWVELFRMREHVGIWINGGRHNTDRHALAKMYAIDDTVVCAVPGHTKTKMSKNLIK